MILKSFEVLFVEPPICGNASPFVVILARIAAPSATASSTLTPLNGSLPDISFTYLWIILILVEPPTRITPSICCHDILTDENSRSITSRVVPSKNSEICSKISSVISIFPRVDLHIIGTFTVSLEVSCFLTFSAVTSKDATISGSSLISIPYRSENSPARYLAIQSSQSLPPNS